MEVTTDNARAVLSQKMVLELLLSDMPEQDYTRNNELDQWAQKLKMGKPRFESRQQPRRTCRTRRSRSTSTPASSARAACAPAARSR